jgi:hypothetical protein
MPEKWFKEQSFKETFVHEIMDKELITITPLTR